MSKRENRAAIAAVWCEVCHAKAGDPCRSYNQPHHVIKGIHALRTLAYRALSDPPREPWREASEGPSGLIPCNASLGISHASPSVGDREEKR